MLNFDLAPNAVVGRWLLVERRGVSWVVKCTCGNVRLVTAYVLSRGKSRSCGECERIKRPPKGRAKVIVDLAETGMKQSEIAARLGITRQAIHDTLQRYKDRRA